MQWRYWCTPLSAVASTTATASSLVSAVNCYRGCNQSRMQMHVWSLEPVDPNPIAWRLFYDSCIGYQYASELLSRRLCWYTNVGMAWLRHTCRHTVSQRHHTLVGVTCRRPAESGQLTVPRTRQTTETAVLPFTGQSCGTVFQPISVCWTFHCRCSGNDWKCSYSRITVIVQRLTWRICCVAKFAPYKCR